MTRQIVVQSPTFNRRQPLLEENNEKNRGVGEMAGGTAAECAAVCCCVPCALMNMAIMALYKVPSGLYRKARRKNKRKRLLKKKRALLQQHTGGRGGGTGPTDGEDFDSDDSNNAGEAHAHSVDHHGRTDAVDWERETWNRFYGSGFWRSGSQRED